MKVSFVSTDSRLHANKLVRLPATAGDGQEVEVAYHGAKVRIGRRQGDRYIGQRV